MEILINKLPTPTWNKLKLNNSSVSINNLNNLTASFDIPANIKHTATASFGFDKYETSLGNEFDTLIKNSHLQINKFICPKNQSPEKPLYIDLNFEKGKELAGVYEFEIEENCDICIIMDFYNTKASSVLGFVQSRFILHKNSKLHLIQVQRTANDFTFINDITSKQEEGASLKLTKLILSSRRSFDSFLIDLDKYKASFENDMLYLVDNDNELDINYIINHRGIKTRSYLDIKGILRDRAKKTFRGTIDIKKGAVNASGKENEAVLLIDDDVINKSIPIILCSEEDVEGAHGASIGKLDEEILFYMQSRGIEEKKIYKIIAKARVEELCQKIKDEKTISKIRNFLGGSHE